MRGTRWLILLAIVAILGASVLLYLHQKQSVAQHDTPLPAILPPDTKSTAIDYEYGQSTGGQANYKVKAKGYRQLGDTENYELTGLELQILRNDHEHYDLIKSAKAQFNQSEGHMYSEGEVEITLNVPINGPPPHPLTWIKSSGVTFDSKTGKAVTERATEFRFESGEGKCVGASYDPTTRELHLVHNPELTLRGKGPNAKPMQVEAGEILYKETNSVVWLLPWSKMVRAENTIDAAGTVINLKEGRIDSIDAQKAQGIDKYPRRELHYSADSLHVSYDDDGHIRQMTGTGNAHLQSSSEGASTDTHSDRADLDFEQGQGESILRHVLATGNATVQSKPAPDDKGKIAETRIMKSQSLEVAMRPGGREIDQVRALAPGALEFLPNAPDQHRRLLNGDHMVIGYGAKNAIQSFDAINVTTVTFPESNEKTKGSAPSKTASLNMKATFDSHGQLATMKQWDRFNYEQGERHAKAAEATLDNQSSVMDLEKGARIWDNSGSTEADHIRMQQKSGDYAADGHVMTSRLPDQDPKKKQSGELLDGDEPIQGTAPRMTSANRNRLVHYDGGTVLWQGSNRIQAERVDIDREKHMLVAEGQVVTQLLDEKKDKADETKTKTENSGDVKIVRVSTVPAGDSNKQKKAEEESAVYTVVTAQKLLYMDDNRLAHYSGGVVLTRPGLHVKSDELQAFLNAKDSDEDSRLNHAIGDRNVEIVDSRPDRQRIGKGDHCEYYTSEDKLILHGNLAELTDSLKGDSKGAQLTYYTSDDRLIIAGSSAQPVNSRLKRKVHPNGNPGNR